MRNNRHTIVVKETFLNWVLNLSCEEPSQEWHSIQIDVIKHIYVKGLISILKNNKDYRFEI